MCVAKRAKQLDDAFNSALLRFNPALIKNTIRYLNPHTNIDYIKGVVDMLERIEYAAKNDEPYIFHQLLDLINELISERRVEELIEINT